MSLRYLKGQKQPYVLANGTAKATFPAPFLVSATGHADTQPLAYPSDAETLPQTGEVDATTCPTTLSLSDFFLWALEQNKAHYAARQGTHRYASPLFKLAQCLKAHPNLKDYEAKAAFRHLNKELQPNWGKLFPDVPLPSLEFITAWAQVNIPAGASIWAMIETLVTNQPLTLLETPACEGLELYLAIAFHLQKLFPKSDILLPVGPLSGLLTKLVGKEVSERSVSHYSQRAVKDGYIKLTAKSHHPSGKAAGYRFNMKWFTESGVELDHE